VSKGEGFRNKRKGLGSGIMGQRLKIGKALKILKAKREGTKVRSLRETGQVRVSQSMPGGDDRKKKKSHDHNPLLEKGVRRPWDPFEDRSDTVRRGGLNRKKKPRETHFPRHMEMGHEKMFPSSEKKTHYSYKKKQGGRRRKSLNEGNNAKKTLISQPKEWIEPTNMRQQEGPK